MLAAGPSRRPGCACRWSRRVHGCGHGARSCDDRWIRRAIGRNVRPTPGIRHYFLVTEGEELPGSVRAAYERASSAGFELACEVEVGRLLAALAAAVPGGGRVLEIGTGVGVGLAWLVHGLGARRDVEVVTVELDDEVQRTARSAPWPLWVRFESGDGAQAVGGLGQFDLIFPDAPGGKIFKLRTDQPNRGGSACQAIDGPPVPTAGSRPAVTQPRAEGPRRAGRSTPAADYARS